EQQQRWAGGQRPAELHQPRLAGRQLTGPHVRDAPEVQSVEQQVDLRGDTEVRPVVPREHLGAGGPASGPAAPDLRTDLEVLADGERPEDLEALEGASDAEAR